jgi:hypothetical protein
VRKFVVPLVAAGIAVASCNGTTGDALYTFNAYATGASDAGKPFPLNGYLVQLTSAQMYIGAVYVNEAPAGSGGTFNTPVCIDPGIYCAQVPGGIEVNLLSTKPQAFSAQGSGSADLGLSWDLYLAYGDVNNPEANSAYGVPNIADLAGTATRISDGAVFPWAATVNINSGVSASLPGARGAPVEQAGQPGAAPICLARILHLGGISLTLSQGTSMLLTIDPRAWFQAVANSFEPPNDFSTLPSVASPQCSLDNTNLYPDSATVCIPDSSWLPGSEQGSEQGKALYEGIFTGGNAAYTLSYTTSP